MDRQDFAEARIAALAEQLGSRDGLIEADAARNLTNRQPAFWSKAGGSVAPAWTLCGTINMRASIEAAQEELHDFFRLNGRDVYAARWLDDLLPLNEAALIDLQAAYERVGAFPSKAELIRRTDRVGGFTDDMADAMAIAAE